MNKNLKKEYPEITVSFHENIVSSLDKLEDNQEIKKYNRSPYGMIAIAAVVAIIFMSVTVFAANTVYDYFVNKNNYKVTLNVNEDTTVNAESPEYVKLEFGYLPDYLIPDDAPYKFGVKTESGNDTGSGLTFQLFETDTAKNLEIFYAGSVTECMFGENQGAIVKIDTGIESDGDDYDKQFLIYFKDFGYVLRCYVSEKISEDEMLKIAENISLVESDKENAFIVDTYIPTTENGGILEPASDFIYSYTADATVRKIGEAFDVTAYNGDIDGNDYTLCIKNIEIRDNINGLDVDSFGPTADLEKMVDDNGYFKEYERKTYDYGDGVNSVATIKKTETVGRRIILVDIEVGNNENIANEFYIDASVCSISGTLESNKYNSFEATYISGQNGKSSGFYQIPFVAGEKKTVTYGFIIDADADYSDLMFIVGSMWDVSDGVVIE